MGGVLSRRNVEENQRRQVPDDVYSEGIVKVYDSPYLPGSLVDDDVVQV
jgi:hypothetical protein